MENKYFKNTAKIVYAIKIVKMQKNHHRAVVAAAFINFFKEYDELFEVELFCKACEVEYIK